MEVIIVYDSYFGNTEKIARAIALALEAKGSVRLAKVSEVTPEELGGVDLLIAGSPTRAFKHSDGMSEFLAKIPTSGLQGKQAAVFDTRMPAEDVKNFFYTTFSGIFGFAAKKIGDRLQKQGAKLIVPPEGFAVLGAEGPLKEGELERAEEWGRQILAMI